MSLSLFPALAADKPAPEQRASQAFVNARHPATMDTGAEPGEFARLVEEPSVSAALKAMPAIPESVPAPADVIVNLSGSSEETADNSADLIQVLLPVAQPTTASGAKPALALSAQWSGGNHAALLPSDHGLLRQTTPASEGQPGSPTRLPPVDRTVAVSALGAIPGFDRDQYAAIAAQGIASPDQVTVLVPQSSPDSAPDPGRDTMTVATPKILDGTMPDLLLTGLGDAIASANQMPQMTLGAPVFGSTVSATLPGFSGDFPQPGFVTDHAVATVKDLSGPDETFTAQVLPRAAVASEARAAAPWQDPSDHNGNAAVADMDGTGAEAKFPVKTTDADNAKGRHSIANPPQTSHPQLLSAYATVTGMAQKEASGHDDSAQVRISQPETKAERPAEHRSGLTLAAGIDARQGNVEKTADMRRSRGRIGAEFVPDTGFSSRTPLGQPTDFVPKPKGVGPVSTVVEIAPQDAGSPNSAPLEMLRHHPAAATFEPTTSALYSRATAVHVATQLAQVAGQTGPGTTDITLNPRELGQVRLTLQTIEGTMLVLIAAERPETTELMRRHIDSLAQEFRGLGYQDVSFSFSGRDRGQGPAPDTGQHQSSDQGPSQHNDTDGVSTPDRYVPRRIAAQTGGTGLDLRL